MTYKIYKYPIASDCTLEIPKDSKILGIFKQNDTPVLYVEFQVPVLAEEKIKIHLCVTGAPFYKKDSWIYLGTIMQFHDSFVGHYYMERL